MKRILLAAVIFQILVTAAHAHDAKEKPAPKVPLETFFRNPEIIQVRISPDGQHLAWLAPYQDHLNLFVQDIDKKSPPRQLTHMTDRGIQQIAWKGPNHILFMRDYGGDENTHVFSVAIDGKSEARDLTPWPKAKSGIKDTLARISDTDILVSSNNRNPQVFDVLRINVETGETRVVVENPGNVVGYMTDHDGVVRIAVVSNGLYNDYLYRKDEKSPFVPLISVHFNDSFDPVMFSYDDDNKVYAASNLGRDKTALVLYNLETRKEEQVIFADNDVDVGEGLTSSDVQRKILMLSYEDARVKHKFFDKDMEGMFADLKRLLPGDHDFSIKGGTLDEKTFVIVTSSDKAFAKYYIYRVGESDPAKRLQFVADSAPWISELKLANQMPVKYTARDGLVINGYLTLPVGRPAKNLPVIIHPHGGPWGVRDSWGFDPGVQFLANRGYAVLQMNYRGSAGYGRHFQEISYKQWGIGTMQHDITDGVHWLIKEGIADPKRVGIYGGSYGGYATLAGITYTPDLYAAAVDLFGVSNLFTFLKSFPEYWKVGIAQYLERLGDPEKEKERFHAASPALNTDKIKTPLLVAQGANDPRVNISESDQVVENLRKRGVEVEYLVFPDEGHGFGIRANQVKFYEAVEKFLAQHLHPDRDCETEATKP